MGDVDYSRANTAKECPQLSSQVIKLAYGQAASSSDVEVFNSGEHTVTKGTVIACGSASVQAMTDDVTALATDNAVVDAHKWSTVHAFGQARVHADGSAHVFAHDQSAVDSRESAQVRAYDEATVNALGWSQVRDVHHQGSSHAQIKLGEKATSKDVLLFDQGEHWLSQGAAEVRGKGAVVHVSGTADIEAFDEGQAILCGESTGIAWDHSTLIAKEHSTAYGFQQAQVQSFDQAMVHAHDRPTVWAHDHSEVAANDESLIFAYDNTTVHARDSMGRSGGHIDAYGNTVVIRDRYDAGPEHVPLTLHDHSIFQDTDDKGNVISVRGAPQK